VKSVHPPSLAYVPDAPKDWLIRIASPARLNFTC
jgi:hypothetical protein